MTSAPAPVVTDQSAPLIQWRRTFVDGRPASYAVAGAGEPLLLVHGWALGHHSYRRVVELLAAGGNRVYAPALPGFGATADLPRKHFSVRGYARFLDGFAHALKLDGAARVIGHSFGGAVATKFAHTHPTRVRSLVLVNAVGGAAWDTRRGVRPISERPLWNWALHFPGDILPLGNLTTVLPAVIEDAVPNLIRNPFAVWRTSALARRADLTTELGDLAQRGLPIVAMWGDRDRIIPRASFEAICAAAGTDGHIVSGNHSWLLADPDGFVSAALGLLAEAEAASST